MKASSVFKYIFVIFVIVIVCYAGYKLYKGKDKEENNLESSSSEQENIVRDLRLGVCNYDTLNPLITTNKEILNIDTLIFEPLFTVTKDYKLQPCLATEWSKTGDNTYVIKIDTTVKWHDGAYVTAKDVQFTIDKLKEGSSVYKYNVSHITGVEVVDASTVKILVDQEEPFFEYNLIFPIMSNRYYFNEDFYNSSKAPIGTGQFKITDANSTSITLSKNEDWKKIASNNSKINTIKINIYSSMGEVFNSFKLGNIDLINTTNQNYQEYIGTIGFNLVESSGRQFDFLSLNCNDSILQDKYVRQALSYAIDKENIISYVYNNQKKPATYTLDYGHYLYEQDDNSSGYNPEQAKKILQDNGWSYSNNKWRKNLNGITQSLNIKIAICKDSEDRVRVANVIKDQLANIGVGVTVTEISNSKYQEYLANKDYQILITGVYNSYSPNLSYFFGNNNIENYYNETILSIINSGISTKNDKGLQENYKKIYEIYKDEVPFIGLYRDKNITILKQNLVGQVNTNNYSTFYNISDWYKK